MKISRYLQWALSWVGWGLVKIVIGISCVFVRTPLFPRFWGSFIASSSLGAGSGLMRRKKYKAAFQEFQKVVRYGDEVSQELAYEELGKMYENGLGVDKDALKAEECFLKAGSRGESPVIHRVAINTYVDGYKSESNQSLKSGTPKSGAP